MTRRPHPDQLSLDRYFEVERRPEPTPGALDYDARVRNLLSTAIKESDRSRAEIAAAMTDLVYGDAGEGEITKAQLDSWTAPSRADWRFPLAYLPAFVKATNAHWLLDTIAESVGCKVLVGAEAVMAQVGALELQERHIKGRKAALLKSLNADPANLMRKARP